MQARYVIGVAAMLLVAACATTPNRGKQDEYTYQGTWEGELLHAATSIEGEELKWSRDLHVRVTFSRNDASVAAKIDGEWQEVKPGTFALNQSDTNLVMTSFTTGNDDDGTWVETWSFAMTPIDATHLDVLWQRQVKNKNMDTNNQYAVFGGIAYGELVKQPD